MTILGAPDDTEVLVLEMGMRGFGEIARLCARRPARHRRRHRRGPVAHRAVGGIDGVARAKGELVEALPAAGTAVLNADDDRVAAMAARTGRRRDHVRRTHARPTCGSPASRSTSSARPRFDAAHAVGRAAGRAGRQRRPHGGRTPLPRSPSPASVGVDLAAAADRAVGGAPLSSMRMQLLDGAGRRARDQRRLQRQPDVDDRRPRRARRRRRRAPGRRARRDGRARPIPTPATAPWRPTLAELGIEVIAVGTERYGVAPVDRRRRRRRASARSGRAQPCSSRPAGRSGSSAGGRPRRVTALIGRRPCRAGHVQEVRRRASGAGRTTTPATAR